MNIDYFKISISILLNKKYFILVINISKKLQKKNSKNPLYKDFKSILLDHYVCFNQ